MSVPGALGTFPMALNDSMAVTGYHLVSPTVAYGFLEDAAGIITTFKVGGSIWTLSIVALNSTTHRLGAQLLVNWRRLEMANRPSWP